MPPSARPFRRASISPWRPGRKETTERAPRAAPPPPPPRAPRSGPPGGLPQTRGNGTGTRRRPSRATPPCARAPSSSPSRGPSPRGIERIPPSPLPESFRRKDRTAGGPRPRPPGPAGRRRGPGRKRRRRRAPPPPSGPGRRRRPGNRTRIPSARGETRASPATRCPRRRSRRAFPRAPRTGGGGGGGPGAPPRPPPPPPRPAPARGPTSPPGPAPPPPREVGDQRHLVAIGKLGALQAIGPDLLGEFGLVHFVESELHEELRLVGQRENTAGPEHDRLGDARFHELRPDPAPHVPLAHGKGPHLGEVFPHDMDGRGPGQGPPPLLDR